jgi:hypothetical protein
MMTVTGVGDIVQRTRESCLLFSWCVGGRTIKRSGSAVCGLHRTRGDEKHKFLD